MATRSRIRRTLDFGRLREAMAAPGADPRSWVVLARVDDDPDAVSWVVGTGWVADVTFTSGALAGEGPVACRVAAALGGAGSARLEPVRRGSEVVVGVVDGDPNSSGPVILGVLANPQDGAVPTTVNGTPIDEALALRDSVLVTDGTVRQQAAGYEFSDGQPADQQYVRGNDQQAALADFLDAFDTWAGLVQAGLVAAGSALDNTQILLATQALRAKLVQALSAIIRGR